ncbi:MAG: response regulator [Longimicrobiales bacterium]
MTILIAEDDPVSCRLLESHLRQLGHEVVVTHDGAEALREFEGQHFPIVISDWMMPVMDGIELIRRIRSHSRTGYVYTILLTAKSQKEDIARGMEAGADDFVTKPFDRDELRVRLRAGERIIRLEEVLADRYHDLRSVVDAPRTANWAGLTSVVTGEIEAVILNLTNELGGIRSQVPPGQPSDPLLAAALDHLARARERLDALRAQAPRASV